MTTKQESIDAELGDRSGAMRAFLGDTGVWVVRYQIMDGPCIYEEGKTPLDALAGLCDKLAQFALDIKEEGREEGYEEGVNAHRSGYA